MDKHTCPHCKKHVSPDGPMAIKVKVHDGEVVVDLAHDPMVCVLLVKGDNEANEPQEIAMAISTVELARIAAALTQAAAKAIRLDTEAWDLQAQWEDEARQQLDQEREYE